MHTLLIVLVLCSGLGLLTATISSSTIDSDMAELMKLYRDMKALTPSAARRAAESGCQMIDQCCPQVRSTFISLIVSKNSQALHTQCFGERGSSGHISKVLSCAPMKKLFMMKDDPQLMKYQAIMKSKLTNDDENMRVTAQVCSSDEVMSIICNGDNLALVRSCQQKILEKYAQEGDNVYTEKIEQFKTETRAVIDALKQTFRP